LGGYRKQVIGAACEALATDRRSKCPALEPVSVLWDNLLQCYNDALWCMEATREARTKHRAYMMLLHSVVLPMHQCAEGADCVSDGDGEAGELDDSCALGVPPAMRTGLAMVFFCAWRRASADATLARLGAASKHWHTAQASRQLCSAAVMLAWKQRAARARRLHAYELRHPPRRRARMLLRYFVTYKQHAARARGVRAKHLKLAQTLGARMLLRYFVTYKQHAAHARGVRAKHLKLAQTLGARMLLRCFAAWRQFVVAKCHALAQGLHTFQHDRARTHTVQNLLRLCVAWKQHAVARSGGLAWRLHAYQRKHARTRCVYVVQRCFIAWNQHAQRPSKRRMATRCATKLLQRACTHWKHRVITSCRVTAKYGACGRQLLATARDIAFVARAAWRNGFKARRAKVLCFEERSRLHQLWISFEVMTCPVVRRKRMNGICLRRHNWRLRGAFDALANLVDAREWQALQAALERRTGDATEHRAPGPDCAQPPAQGVAPVQTAATAGAPGLAKTKPDVSAVQRQANTSAGTDVCEDSYMLRPALETVRLEVTMAPVGNEACKRTKVLYSARAQSTRNKDMVCDKKLAFLPLRANKKVQTRAEDALLCCPAHIAVNVTVVQCILYGRGKVVDALDGEPSARLPLDATVRAAFAACIAGELPLPPYSYVGQALEQHAGITPHNLGMSPEEVVRLAVDIVRMPSEDGGSQRQPRALDAVRQVVHSIQALRGCKSANVPKHTLFWWAAITETTVRVCKSWRCAVCCRGKHSD
jgi:hypothetical protein